MPPQESIRSFVLFPTSLPRSHPTKPLLQALQIRISDRQRNVLLMHLTYFWARRYFQHSSFSELHCRLSYPSAVLCSCANEMNVQKRERPRRMQSLERGGREREEKKISRVYRACSIWRRFHRFAPFLFENIQFSLVNPEIVFPTKNRPVLIMNYNARMVRSTNHCF